MPNFSWAARACILIAVAQSEVSGRKILGRRVRRARSEFRFWNGRRVALITGITGQDGSYLSELLLDKGYTVHGIRRHASSFNTHRLDGILKQTTLHYGDLADSARLAEIVGAVRPTEIYNLAAQSHVATSFIMPLHNPVTGRDYLWSPPQQVTTSCLPRVSTSRVHLSSVQYEFKI